VRGGAFGGSGNASDRLIGHDLAPGRCISGLGLGVYENGRDGKAPYAE
jgi:hypothetical protein